MKNDSLLFGLFKSFLAGAFLLMLLVVYISIEQFLKDDTIDFNIEGGSMVEYGLNDGDKLKVNTEIDCNIGDTCVFKWKKCMRTDYCGNIDHVWVKQLVGFVNNNCYVFEGNPSGEGTKDWRNFGCLTPDKFEVIGVISPVDNFRQPTSYYSNAKSSRKALIQ